jgi:tetratricopeptide (TPR) repeat protein
LAEIEADIENVRGAWRYYLEQRNSPQMWKFIFSIWLVHWIRWWNHPGVEFFAELAKTLQGHEDRESTALRALALACQGYFMAFLAVPKQGYELTKEGIEILSKLDYPEALVLAYDCLAVNNFFLGQFSEQVTVASKMVEIATEMDDMWLIEFSLWALGMATLMEEDYSEAKRLAEDVLNLNKEIGDEFGSALPLIILGHVAFVRGEYEEAREIYLQCLKISEQLGFYYEIQTATKYLGKVTISVGKLAEAENYLVQCLKIAKEVGFVRDVVNLLYEFARLRVAQGEIEGAIELLALVVQHPTSHAVRMLEGPIIDSAKRLLAELDDELSPGNYTAALERGQELELDEIVAGLIG